MNDYERVLIDPDSHYPMGGPREAEERALELLRLLIDAQVTRTRDVIQLDEPDRRGIVALVTPEALELRFPTIEWHGPHTPALVSKLWRRVEWKGLAKGELADLVAARPPRPRPAVPPLLLLRRTKRTGAHVRPPDLPGLR